MKSKKKLLSLLLCLTLIVTLIPANTTPVKATDDDASVKVQTADNLAKDIVEAEIINPVSEVESAYVYDATTRTLKIFTEEGTATWRNDSSIAYEAIANIVFGPNVHKIMGTSPFGNLPNLRSVEFEGDIKVGNSNFKLCQKLLEVTFDGESVIENDAFSQNTSLRTVTFSKKTTIKDASLCGSNTYQNTAMKSITFPEGTVIENYNLFDYYTGLASITFDGDITLGSGTFNEMEGLETVIFNGKATLKEGAFQNNKKLSTVIFKDTSVLMDSTLRGCPSIKNLTFEKSTTMKDNAMVAYGEEYNNALTTLIIPAGSDIRYNNAFSYCQVLKSVTFEGDVAIGQNNFGYCPELETVVFKGESVICEGALYCDPKLKDVTFAKKTYITDGAFAIDGYNGNNNTAMESITFPAGSEIAKNAAFEYYDALKSVTFEGDIELGGMCFAYCPALEEVTFEGKSVVENGAFEYDPKLKTINFGGPTELSEAAFYTNSEYPNDVMTEITIPDGSKLIAYGDYCGRFSRFDALKKITFEGDVTLDSNVFLGNGNAYDNPTFDGVDKMVPLKSLDTLEFKAATPPSFPEVMLGVYDPDNFTIIADCVYREEFEKDPEDPADELLHNAAFVNCVTGKHNIECGHAKYKIIEGDNTSYVLESDKEVKIVSDAPFDKFVSVKLDDQIVAPENYKAVSGSTDVTFSTGYLDTLEVGKYVVEIESSDGSAYTYLTIKAKLLSDDPKDPDDSDDPDDSGDLENPDDSDDAGDEMTDEPHDTEVSDDAPKTGDHAYPFVIFVIMMGAAWISVMAAKKRKEA